MKKIFATGLLLSRLLVQEAYGQSAGPDLAYHSARPETEPSMESSSPAVFPDALLAMVTLEAGIAKRIPVKAVIGYTQGGRPVEVYFFPGTTSKRALLIGGMHGSELSSIELAQNVLALLKGGARSDFDVFLIPSLFPDNAAKATAPGAKVIVNLGRYSGSQSPDPNRQMPPLGRAYDAETPVDSYHRPIEEENQFLLRLIRDLRPERIVNLHAIRDVRKAGFFADPRTDCRGRALGFYADSLLAVSMAQQVAKGGGQVPGNRLNAAPTALYANDPRNVAAGALQPRNLHGSPLPFNRGYGVSLGSWATTAVCEGDPLLHRDAITLITVEFPGYSNSAGYEDKPSKEICLRNQRLYSQAIVKAFLRDGK